MAFQPQASLEDLITSGTIDALDEVVILDVNGVSGAKAVVSGTWAGTIKFEQSIDGIRWDNVGAFSGTTGAVLSATGVTSNDIVVFVGIAGVAKIRARFHVYTSGTASVVLRASNGVSNVFVDNLIPANLKTQSQILGSDGVTLADVQLLDGFRSLRTFGIQAIESLRGFDPIADTWFYIGTENDSQGAGTAGDTVRVQIAAGDNPTDFPAIDITYTLVAGDAGDEEQLAVNLAAYLNANGTFSTLWRAQRIANSGVIYITSKKPGSQFERPITNDFQVTSTGTTVVTRAFDKIIRQNKVTSLARDPADPRQGILGIQGSVVQTEGDVTNRFQTVFSELRVNGSVTPVDFTVSAHATEVRFITSVVLSGRANGMKFGQFLASATLTNGIQVSFKSNDFSVNREPLKTTDDLLDFHAEDPDNFVLFIQAGGDKFTAVLEFGSPLEIRPQGEFVSNDYIKISVRDNLTSGLLQLRATVSGFNREF